MTSTLRPEPAVRALRADDHLISVRDIRALFGLGRTAAYELTHRPGFPRPVVISPRCHRWWASEVTDFANAMRADRAERRRPASRSTSASPAHPAMAQLRITGTIRAARTRRAAS